MPSITKTEHVPFSQQQMYDLVNAIEDYPHFLPWCSESDVISRSDDEVKATLHLSVGGMTKSFTTLNRLHPHSKIALHLVEGPFKHLEGCWLFENTGENECQVKLELEFEMAGGFLDMMIGPMFNQVANSLVDAFCQHAHAVYAQKKVENTEK